GRLVDHVVARAVRRAGEGDAADVTGTGGKVSEVGDPLPGPVHLGVEAVVAVTAAPADGQHHLGRVPGVDGDVAGEVLVRRVRRGRHRTAGQVVRVGRELEGPRAGEVAQRVAPHALAGGGPGPVAAEADLMDAGAVQFRSADPAAGAELAPLRVVEHEHA